MARVTVRERDKGFDEMLRRAKKIADKGAYCKVGVLAKGKGAAVHDAKSGLTTAELAVIHEFGAPGAHIPQRSFIRSTLAKQRKELRAMAALFFKQILDGKMEAPKALGLMGAYLSAEIKKAVTTGPPIPPPLSPGYAAEKLMKRKGAKKLFHLEKGEWWIGKESAAYHKDTGEKVDASSFVRTLVDTGRMINALTWQVVRKSK